MTRTTIDIDPGLLDELKQIAARSRQSMSGVANLLLGEALQRRECPAQDRSPPLEWNISDSGPAPGFDPATRDHLDMLDDEPWG